MAIQVGGTTVINNSRQLQNISGLDATSQGNFPFLQDITTSTTSYTPTGTNQTVDDKESISTLNQASTTISKTTSTSMTKVVINSTLPTFSNTDVLTISSAATVSNGVTTGGYAGGWYRVWVEISGNLLYSVLQRGSFSTQASTSINQMNIAAEFNLSVDNTASTPPNSGSLTKNLNLISGGMLLVEFFNYPSTPNSQYGYFTFNDLDFDITVIGNVSPSFYTLGIL
tara:strand:+ start:1049 stop:1729 length:681 start_codon:yes stop_codon:yes gene_type:complete